MKVRTHFLTAALALLFLTTGARAQTAPPAETLAKADERAELKGAANGETKPAAKGEAAVTAPASKHAPKPAAQQPKQRKIGDVNFNGSLRLRAENYGWFATPGFEDDYTFGAAVLRLSVGQQKEK